MTSANSNTATLVRVARLKSRLLHRLTEAMVEVIAAEEGGEEATADALLVSALEEVTQGLSDQGLPGEVFDERRLSALFLEARRQVGRHHPASGSHPQSVGGVGPEATTASRERAPNARSPAGAVTGTGRRREPGDLDIASMIDDMLSRPR